MARRQCAASASTSRMSSKASSTTSADTGPATRAQISFVTSLKSRPDLAISDGLVVTPSSRPVAASRSEEHTSELQSLMRISYAVFCLKKKTTHHKHSHNHVHGPTQHYAP